jgi:NAD(P)-dependent dehydrogenase (short-subunit alcohol dehydrogenase family)
LVKRIGKIDILVNSAGLSHRAAWQVPQSEDWKNIMTLNVESPFWLAQLLMPAMIEQGWGRVINISSICGLISGNPAHLPGLGIDMPSYYTSKHALIGLTRFLATQVATTGVTVNAICPGPFDSPANRQYFSPGPILDALIVGIPMARIGAEGELRTAIQFLAAPGSSFVTGQSIVVDGGITVW